MHLLSPMYALRLVSWFYESVQGILNSCDNWMLVVSVPRDHAARKQTLSCALPIHSLINVLIINFPIIQSCHTAAHSPYSGCPQSARYTKLFNCKCLSAICHAAINSLSSCTGSLTCLLVLQKQLHYLSWLLEWHQQQTDVLSQLWEV